MYLNTVTSYKSELLTVAGAAYISGTVTATSITVGTTFQTGGYTVATLPAGVLGARTYVTDATSPTFLGTLTGGGAVRCPVFYNGTAWVAG